MHIDVYAVWRQLNEQNRNWIAPNHEHGVISFDHRSSERSILHPATIDKKGDIPAVRAAEGEAAHIPLDANFLRAKFNRQQLLRILSSIEFL